MSLLILFCKRVASVLYCSILVLGQSLILVSQMYQFPNFYWQTNRVPFDEFAGNIFSDGTCNCVGQCVNVIVNFVPLLSVVLVIVDRMAKLMSIQSTLWNNLTIFLFYSFYYKWAYLKIHHLR